jgi:3-hydroxyacyl-CoA dehydrogenase
MPASTTAVTSTKQKQIRKVAVLGAGTMGSRIAAHMTNAGLPVVLLDIVPPGTEAGAAKQERNRFVLAAMDGLKKSKPAAFYSPESAKLITIGNFDDDLALIADCDWIIEVVAENLEIKRALLDKVQKHRRADSIITSNTSGLPIHEIVEGMPMELRRHWFGTHFFNPPRYMRLLEIIPTPDTDPADVAAVEHFCDLRLGKAIVHSHDTPNFIANRIGTFSMGNAIRLMQSQGLSIH